jgi:AcrR family transcriptional regulator
MATPMSAVKTSDPRKVTRRDRAKATRLRIIRSAYSLFCERGYTGTTMADVAKAAGVAVQTVYFTFHTKSELLSQTYDVAVMGEVDPLPPERQAWYLEMTAEKDVTRALRFMVAGIGAILVRAAPLDTIVRASAAGDPDSAAVRALHERWRAEGYRSMLDLLQGTFALRPGVTPERAIHLLLLYLGMDVYRVLVHDLGWKHDEWIDWTVATLAEQVFAASGSTRP